MDMQWHAKRKSDSFDVFSLEILKKREGSILDIVLITLPAVRHKIFKQIKKKKNQQRRMWKNKTFFLYFIESFILDIIPASIWELLKSFYKIWFCYRQAGYRIYCKATECSFLYLLDGFDTINFLTPELRNKLHMTTSCLNYV